jgi:alkylation response protein AidB-like acyl-CoA dehydrogenase
VFFDDVKVPVENLVGQEHRGWDCAKFLLGNERTGIARVGYSKQRVQRIKELAARVNAGDRPLIEDERFREKVAAVEVELKALEMTQMRVLAEDRERKNNMPNPKSSVLKIKGSEIQQATTQLLLEIAGPLALAYQPEPDDPEFDSNEGPLDSDWAAPAAPGYFNYRKVSIYGGSNEIQRNIIAKAVLGF